VELLELVLGPIDAHANLLHSGALPLGGGQAIAWCEMARGLLLHWVQLDAQHRVQDYRVLAPTEWNFHPEGALAQALTQLNPTDAAAAWCLASAYDPCVDCSVNVQETPHA
jgi:Ni,Fe-hydrogenase I large subunit